MTTLIQPTSGYFTTVCGGAYFNERNAKLETLSFYMIINQSKRKQLELKDIQSANEGTQAGTDKESEL